MIELNLDRFIEAQNEFGSYSCALREITDGMKQTHWMWYVFPQIKGLGKSSVSQYFAIQNLLEAQAYLGDSTLGKRLRDICKALRDNNYGTPAERIFGGIDALKLRSSMTLFDLVSPDDIFAEIIEDFCNGQKDAKTLRLLEAENDFLNGTSPYKRCGISICERAFMDFLCHEANDISYHQRLATLAHMVICGYSLKKLGYLYLYNHADLLDAYRNSHLECTFAQLTDLQLEFFGDAPTSKNCCLQQFFEIGQVRKSGGANTFRAWEDAADFFDRLVHAAAHDEVLKGPLNELLAGHSLLKHPPTPQPKGM